ncbi:tandem-95 repeat protein [Moraxellaceae bacterium AER2_44_116]|nr:cadherin-like domain-containing protein [Moraxellaceae bacterium]TQC97169.1 tandem-95 repeat protein [Moraxellaceae bacterium AER2_44_116]
MRTLSTYLQVLQSLVMNNNAATSITTRHIEITVNDGLADSSVTGFNVEIQPAPVLPTQNDDVLLGTDAADTIDALAGNDSVDGLAGDDVLIGGDGNDTLIGGLGDDILTGGLETDSYQLGLGDDTVIYHYNQDGADDIIEDLTGEQLDAGMSDGIETYKIFNVPNNPNIVWQIQAGTTEYKPNLVLTLGENNPNLGLKLSDEWGDSLPVGWQGIVIEDFFTRNPADSTNGVPVITAASAQDVFVFYSDDGVTEINRLTGQEIYDTYFAPQNQAPVLAGTPATLTNGTEDTVYTVYAGDLLQGFSDVDVLSVINLQATNGILTDNQDGTYTFTPNANFNGSVNVSYQVTDNQGGIVDASNSIVFNAVNDAPIAKDDDVSSNNPITIDVLANDTDLEGDVLQVIEADIVQGSGIVSFDGTSVTYDPAGYNFNSTVLIEYTIQDMNGLTSTASISVHGAYIPPNSAPEPLMPVENQRFVTGVNNSYTLAPDTFTDLDGDDLTYSAALADGSSLPSWLVFDAATQTFSGMPSNHDSGLYTIEVMASDGQLSASQTFEINAYIENRPPMVSELLQAQKTKEREAFSYQLPVNAFIDLDSDVLTYTATLSDGSGLPSWLTFDATTQTFSGIPTDNDAGELSILVRARDNDYAAEQVFKLTIDNVNFAPTGSPTASLVDAQENGIYQLQADQLLEGFSDADGDTLVVVNLSADHATVQNNSNGTFTLTLQDNYNGLLQLSYQIIDGQGGIISVQQSLSVVAPIKVVGTTGGDLLQGGTNNDTYVVNHYRDLIVDDGGIDTVESELSYQLRESVENLTLLGASNLSGIGNAADNILRGNEGKNRLLSGGGFDTLYGGAGGDTLNGGAGADVMYGGAGNDTFTVENADDVVVEFDNEGFDTVNSFISYTLTANVERLILEGSDNLNGFGNVLDNTLNGNNANNYLVGGAGNDTLQGKGGADTLEGGIGNDLYYVDNVGDVVTELLGEGYDKVSSLVSYSLTANVEQLFLTGIAGLTATGNALNNVIYGNDGNNQLLGGAGNDSLNGGSGSDVLAGEVGDDTLVGGLGNDTYLFSMGAGRDTINNTDAVNGNDNVLFDAGISADQLWLRQSGNDLDVSIIGTADSIKMQNWYSDTAKRVDSFELADGKVLLATEVQTLVEAMAAFAPPPLGQTSLNTEQQNALNAVIAANW